LKNLYQEIGDKFEEKVLKVASAHLATNLSPPTNLVNHSVETNSPSGRHQHTVSYSTAKSFSLTVTISSEEISRFSTALSKDDYFSKVLDAISKTEDPLNPPYPQYVVGDNGLLYFSDWAVNLRLCVPKSLVTEIIAEFHDQLFEGAHSGFHRTYNQISTTYYWPRMARDIKR
jgi:hypothetical protein